MAKGPGWYADPWGGTGLRWWDGSNWTEHVQGQPGPGFAGNTVTMRAGPLISSGGPTAWYQQWWVIAVALFLCCWPLGLILLWTRPSTAGSTKAIVTVVWLVYSVLGAVAYYSLVGQLPQPGTTG